ncbi:7024_t:CDS:2, partial [Paraglomus occultum]
VRRVLRNFKKWNCVDNPFRGISSGRKKLFRSTDMKVWDSLFLLSDSLIHKTAAERNELLRSAFIAEIGSDYVPEQFIFVDESAKDERTTS